VSEPAVDEERARALLARYEREAFGLRLRAVLLALLAFHLMGGSVAIGALAGPELALRAVNGLQIVFVLGLGAMIGVGVSLMRLAGANEHAGAAARLREGRVALRSATVGEAGARTMLRLVFADGHRADLFVTKDEAGALLPLVEARVDRGRASAFR
jgi:hypothetical protein